MQEADAPRNRKVKALTLTISLVDMKPQENPRCETDSHADTCVAGSNFLFIGGDGRTVNVTPFSQALQSVPNIPVGTAATLYQDPQTGEEFILLFNECIFFGDKLKGPSLLCPNQMRVNGIQVDDVPQHLDSKSSHSLRCETEDCDLTIPLSLRGVCSGFVSRKPTFDEYNSLRQVVMTSPTEWHPWWAEDLAEKEEAYQRTGVSSVDIQVDQDSSSQDHWGCQYSDNESRLLSSIGTYEAVTKGQSEINFETDQFDWLMEDPYHDAASLMISSVNVAWDDTEGDGLNGYGDHSLYPSQFLANRRVSISSVQCGVDSIGTLGRESILTPEILAKRWHIGLEKAKLTLEATTQSGIRNIHAPSERKLRYRHNHMRFPNLKGRYFTDSMFANTKSKRQFKGAQVFTNGLGYDRFVPFRSKGDETLTTFIHKDGIPQELVSDNAPAEHKGEWGKVANHHRMKLTQTIPGSPWQNRAEHSIKELKVAIRRTMRRRRAPRRLWCYCGEWVSAIRRLTASSNPKMEGRTPEERVQGSTPDITAHALFDWYSPVWYWDPVPTFPFQKKCLGYWIGIEDCSVDVMAYRILNPKGNVVIRKSVWAVTNDEAKDPQTAMSLAQLEADVRDKLGDQLKDEELDPELETGYDIPPDYLFDDPEPNAEPEAPHLTKPEADEYTPEAHDNYLTAKVLLPHGGESARARVVARAKDEDGVPIGTRSPNPLLGTRLYEVERDRRQLN